MTKKKSPTTTRDPLTTEELERMSAHDLYRMKLTDDETIRLREINWKRELQRIERSKQLQEEGRPLVAALREVGWDVRSVWDLVNTDERYPEAVPVLLKHLKRPYSDEIRDGIARALAVREARHAWRILVDEYQKAPQGTGLGAKHGLAVALSVIVTDETLDELIALAKDRSHGSSRLMLLWALRKRRNKNPSAMAAIEELSTDPDLEKEIASWSKR